jgi:hypothetical protein
MTTLPGHTESNRKNRLLLDNPLAWDVYVATNFAAQITAGLTGVTGASIFPLWPPAPPSFPSTPEEATTLDAYLVCGDARGSSAAFWCGGQPVAV